MFISHKNNGSCYLLLSYLLLHIGGINCSQTKEFKQDSGAAALHSLQRTISPTKTFNAFNVKESLKKDHRAFKRFRECALHISPSGQDLIIGTKGSVYKLPLNSKSKATLEELFKHPDVKHSPIIDITQQQNQPLIIASGGNSYSLDAGEYHSHLKIYKADGWSLEKKFDWPIQDLRFDEQGNKLAIAGHNKISLLYIPENYINTIPFGPALYHDILRNISINPKGNVILATSKSGETQFININKKHELNPLSTTFQLASPVNNIHHPNSETILITHKNTVRCINFYHFTGGSLTSEIPSTTVAFTKQHNKITLNKAWTIASAHWVKNSKNYGVSDHDKHSIEIFIAERQNNESDSINSTQTFDTQRYTLITPSNIKKYHIMTKSGQVKEETEHFLSVAFHGDTIVALLSSGKILVWKLPEQSHTTTTSSTTSTTTTTTTTVPCNEQSPETKAPKKKLTRKRSQSFNNDTQTTNTASAMTLSDGNTTDQLSKQKSSPRIFSILSGSSSTPTTQSPRTNRKYKTPRSTPSPATLTASSGNSSKSPSPREKTDEK